jgi:hypothetical protein
MEKIIKNIDFIGPKPQLFINGTTLIQSWSGGLLTIKAIILSILAFVAFGRDLFERKDPVSLTSVEYRQNNAISSEKLKFAIGIVGASGSEIREAERKFRPYLQYYITDIENTTFQRIEMVKCQETYLFKENK